MKDIYRGIWADQLQNNDRLPVGGSIFSDELTISLLLDFDELLGDVSSKREKVESHYEKHKEGIEDWVTKIAKIPISPYLFFVCNTIQGHAHKTLASSDVNAWKRAERISKYGKLSAQKGYAMCGEYAALGQYISQDLLPENFSSSYCGAVTMEKEENNMSDHSFLVLQNKEQNDETFIFDIARPRSVQNLPRILKTDIPFTHEQLKDKKDLLIGATEILHGGRMFFGVGNPQLMYDPTFVEKKE